MEAAGQGRTVGDEEEKSGSWSVAGQTTRPFVLEASDSQPWQETVDTNTRVTRYLWRICSKTPRGCLKLGIIPNPTFLQCIHL